MSEQQTQEPVITQPLPQATVDNICKLRDIAIEAIKSQAEVAIAVLKSAPSTQLVGDISNRLDGTVNQLEDLKQYVGEVKEAFDLNIRNLEARLGCQLPLRSSNLPTAVNGPARREPSLAIVMAEQRLREVSIKRDGFRESVFKQRIARCTGELMRIYHVGVAVRYSAEVGTALGDGRPPKWNSIFEAVDDLGYAQNFYDIVRRFYNDHS